MRSRSNGERALATKNSLWGVVIGSACHKSLVPKVYTPWPSIGGWLIKFSTSSTGLPAEIKTSRECLQPSRHSIENRAVVPVHCGATFSVSIMEDLPDRLTHSTREWQDFLSNHFLSGTGKWAYIGAPYQTVLGQLYSFPELETGWYSPYPQDKRARQVPSHYLLSIHSCTLSNGLGSALLFPRALETSWYSPYPQDKGARQVPSRYLLSCPGKIGWCWTDSNGNWEILQSIYKSTAHRLTTNLSLVDNTISVIVFLGLEMTPEYSSPFAFLETLIGKGIKGKLLARYWY